LEQSSKDAFPNRSPISRHVHPLLVGSGSSVSDVLGIVGQAEVATSEGKFDVEIEQQQEG